jgi:septum formation protein
MSTTEAVRLLARRKSEAVAEQFPAAFVLGADQLVECEGQTLQKPRSRSEARGQLASLLGKTHQIVTGLCLLGPGFSEDVVDVAVVTFYKLSDEELERYLDLGEWEGCAGGYRIEAAGQAFLEQLVGDRATVEGLPMLHVVRLLRKVGFRFF